MNDDKKIIGKCFYCGHEFEYTIKEHFFSKHPNLISIIQIYCSPECENASQREIEKLRIEREQSPTFKQKYCPQCGFVPRVERYRILENCPWCKIPYEFHDVLRYREQRRKIQREYRKRSKNAVQTT